jgi:hypothetical protein
MPSDVVPGAEGRVELHANREFRLEQRQTLRETVPRAMNWRNWALLGVFASFAFIGAILALTFFYGHPSSDDPTADVNVPSVAALDAAPPIKESPSPLAQPAAPISQPAAPDPLSIDPPPPVTMPQNTASPVVPPRASTPHIASAPPNDSCTDCPPIDASDLPPISIASSPATMSEEGSLPLRP